MRILWNRKFAAKARNGKVALVLLAGIVAGWLAGGARSASLAGSSFENAKAVFEQYCVQCHGLKSPKAGVGLAQMLTRASVGEDFQQWEKVAAALEQKTMPPKAMPQPTDEEREQAAKWIRAELAAYATKHDGDPGPVTVRRLTSGEYAYTIKDLTGFDLNAGIDSSSDAVGGEGFTNFGD